jgi:hypothetical protein
MTITKTKFLLLCLLAVALAPVSLIAIQEVDKRMNCPFVYMTTDKQILKIKDSSGKEIFPKSLNELEYYEVVWVSPDYK